MLKTSSGNLYKQQFLHINCLYLNKYLKGLFTYYITLRSPTSFGTRRRDFQQVTYVTVRYYAQHLATNACLILLIKCSLLTNTLFSRLCEGHLGL